MMLSDYDRGKVSDYDRGYADGFKAARAPCHTVYPSWPQPCWQPAPPCMPTWQPLPYYHSTHALGYAPHTA